MSINIPLKKIVIYTLLLLGLIPLMERPQVRAQEQQDIVNIHVFHSKTCPHCASEIEFISNDLLPKYPRAKLNLYEVTDKINVLIVLKTAEKLKADVAGVPFLVIGTEYVTGFHNADTTGKEIENLLKTALITKPEDTVSIIAAEVDKEAGNPGQGSDTSPEPGQKPEPREESPASTIIKVPFIGNFDVSRASLPVLTVVLGLLDGFNPCAMWVLLFLISMLIGVKDRKRMWVLGGTFLLVSALVYFLFMAAWLNVFLIIGYAALVRYIIAGASLAIGFYYLKRFFKNKNGGCETADYEKKQQIFDKIRKASGTRNLFLAALGIASLAVAVNMLELLCSAGLPAIYTKVLSMTSMSQATYYLYLAIYVLFFLIDDIIVFAIAMITFKAVGMDSKYSRYAQLVGGILMLALGIIMLVNPSLLTFAAF